MEPTEIYDRTRAWRIRTGRQSAVDVPVTSLRVLIAGSAHCRTELARALGPRTVEALEAGPQTTGPQAQAG